MKTLVLGTRSYKGAKTPVMVGKYTLQPAPVQEGQKSYKYNMSIRTNRYADKFCKAEQLPEKVLEYWMSEDYKSVAEVAFAKVELQGLDLETALHKARWQVLFNSPTAYSIYTHKVNDVILGMVKFALANGTDIELFDEFTSRTWSFVAVGNMQLCPLYQNFYVSNTEESTALEEAVKKYETGIWTLVEDSIAELKAVYYAEQLEASEERLYWAKRYTVEDYLLQGNYALDAAAALDPEVLDNMAMVVSVYGPSVGISVNTNTIETTTDSYSVYNPNYSAPKESFFGVSSKDFWEQEDYIPNPYLDKKIFAIRYQRKMKAMRKPDPVEVIKAYTQIMFYIENGIENFIDNNYEMCPNCDVPVRKESTECAFCGCSHEQSEVELSSASDNILYGISKSEL